MGRAGRRCLARGRSCPTCGPRAGAFVADEPIRRLEELRAELELTTAPAPTIRLAGLLATWRTGDPIARRELLLTLFEKLHVEGGRIVGYTPREDRAAEVIELLAAAAAAWEVPAKSGAGEI